LHPKLTLALVKVTKDLKGRPSQLILKTYMLGIQDKLGHDTIGFGFMDLIMMKKKKIYDYKLEAHAFH
jgi:hypothetical protein